jgi:hypothetical protein
MATKWVFTTPVAVAQNINQLRNLEVIDVREFSNDEVPRLDITVRVFGSPGGAKYGDYTLSARNNTSSTILVVKPSPENATDQITTSARSLAANVYTTMSGVFNANTGSGGTLALRFLAVKDALWPNGMLDTPFAGS